MVFEGTDSSNKVELIIKEKGGKEKKQCMLIKIMIHIQNHDRFSKCIGFFQGRNINVKQAWIMDSNSSVLWLEFKEISKSHVDKQLIRIITFLFYFFPFFHVFLVCSNCKLELRIKYLQRGGENTHDQPDDLLYWCQPQNSIGGFIVTAKDSHVDIDYTKENHIRIQVLL